MAAFLFCLLQEKAKRQRVRGSKEECYNKNQYKKVNQFGLTFKYERLRLVVPMNLWVNGKIFLLGGISWNSLILLLDL